MEVGSVGEWIGGLSTTLAVLVAWRVATIERNDRIAERDQSERDAVIRSYREQRAAVEGVRLDIFMTTQERPLHLNGSATNAAHNQNREKSKAIFRNLSQTVISSGHIQIIIPNTEDNDARFPRKNKEDAKYERIDLEYKGGTEIILLRIKQFLLLPQGKQAEVELDSRLLDMALSINFDFLDPSGRRWRINPVSEIERVHENGFIPDETDAYFKEESRFPTSGRNSFALESGLYSRHTGIVSGFDSESDDKYGVGRSRLKRLAQWLLEES